MNIAANILDELLDRGIRLAPSDESGMVRVKPLDRMTPVLIAKVRAHKAALLELLAEQKAQAAEIIKIENEALRLGWPLGRLWGSKFWPVELRGLAAVMDPGDLIVAVEADVINIRRPNPHGGGYSELKFRKCHA